MRPPSVQGISQRDPPHCREEDIDLPDVPLGSVSCAEERAGRQESTTVAATLVKPLLGQTGTVDTFEVFQVLQTALQTLPALPHFPAYTKVPTKRRAKRPEKVQNKDAYERKVRLLIVESSLLLPSFISPPRSHILFSREQNDEFRIRKEEEIRSKAPTSRSNAQLGEPMAKRSSCLGAPTHPSKAYQR